MKIRDLPSAVLEHFGIHCEEDLIAAENNIKILAMDDSGFLIEFHKVEEVPESRNPATPSIDYMLTHCDDQDHFLDSYSGQVEGLPYHIVAIHSSYDDAIDISSTYKGYMWLGRACDSQIDDTSREKLAKYAEDEICDDLSWKLRQIAEGSAHITKQNRKAELVMKMADIIRSLSS